MINSISKIPTEVQGLLTKEDINPNKRKKNSYDFRVVSL